MRICGGPSSSRIVAAPALSPKLALTGSDSSSRNRSTSSSTSSFTSVTSTCAVRAPAGIVARSSDTANTAT